MNRRGFLRAAGSLAVAAPIPAVVPVAAVAGSGVLTGSMGAAASVVWTQEMAEAYGVALPLLDEPVQARMAFLEAYRDRVRAARDSGAPVRWVPSLGTDPHGREAALVAAVGAGRLSVSHATALLPVSASQAVIQRLSGVMALGERGVA